MNAVEDMARARALIGDPSDWCGEGWGSDGRRCAIHAICEAAGLSAGAVYDHPGYVTLYGLVGFPGTYNDAHSHAEVLAAFDAAIAQLERAGT